ncbi:MAG: class IV adenylate cyclase [Phycisphaeraceae bacterium]|nr:class IV adenylate cyclase [Phycisphaeraceae bacterium]
MKNIEYKSELRDLPIAREVCRKLGAGRVGLLEQTDTYYRVAAGKLKKRETRGEPTEFIFYERPHQSAPKRSDFSIYDEGSALAKFGQASLPEWVRVKKKRELFLLGNTRIHLDVVENLGTFIEFEFPVTRTQTEAQGHAALAKLRAEFGPVLGEAIDCGYADLLWAEIERANESR